jgi:hypothetical protein
MFKKNVRIMEITKQWLVMQNNYLGVLVKTKSNLYFYFEESNKGSFEKVEKETAKDLIKKTKGHYKWTINR